MVSWEQRTTAGDPKFSDSQDLPPFAYAEYAKMLGLHGTRIDRPQDISGAWQAALAADRLTVLEMVTDPDVPPVPPHITRDQIGPYFSALMKGDPDALGVIVASAKEWWAGLFPPRMPK